MPKWVCANCHHRFDVTGEAGVCPRCTSKRVSAVSAPVVEVTPIDSADKPKEPRAIKLYDARVYGETKAAWKSFHSIEVKQCAKCNGLDFDLDWKHKEKTCRKCGEIYPLPRRSH